ncbi:MAG: DNA methyltransferase [Desulfomonilaceae bacterium]
MIYLDPPYGIKYGSYLPALCEQARCQGRQGRRPHGRARADPRLPRHLGARHHSYLTYLRDRLLLAQELLTKSGSIFVQISDENVHHVRELMDEVFGAGNFVRLITFAKTGSMVSNELGRTSDYLIWYAKEKSQLKYRPLYGKKLPDDFYSNVGLADGARRKIRRQQMADLALLPEGARVFQLVSLESAGPPSENTLLNFEGRVFRPASNNHWKLVYPEGMNAALKSGRVVQDGRKLRWKYYSDDYPLKVMSEVWTDTAGFNPDQRYVAETRTKVVAHCLL